MTSSTQHTYEIYDVADPKKENIDRVIAFVPAGMRLMDCFGSSFIVVDGKQEACKKAPRAPAERGGPQFV